MGNTIRSQQSLLILSGQSWNKHMDHRLSNRLNRKVEIIDSPADLKIESIEAINPRWIFVPHWSHWIPKEIWGRWSTVIFHMTDLPYGRGGSPLQNLIKRGHQSTIVSALRCSQELDEGDIYLKEELQLYGSAEEIYLRANDIIENMIEKIVIDEPAAVPQKGKITEFKRRTPKQSNLDNCPPGDISAWYDHIRMLDAEGYPHAFLDVQGMNITFRRVSIRSDGLHADVIIKPCADNIGNEDMEK